MNKIIIFLGLILPCSTFTNLFINFKKKYNKNYKNLNDEYNHYKIFYNNYIKIKYHNHLYDRDLVSFSLKINEYIDMRKRMHYFLRSLDSKF